MFSFRRKPKHQEVPRIRTSPSLPELNTGKSEILWPENLVDITAIQVSQLEMEQRAGGVKTSFQAVSYPGAVPFHKPFRDSSTDEQVPISSLYMSPTNQDQNQYPPSAYSNGKRITMTTTTSASRQRRARVPPTFNLMIAGGRGTGKTSLLRLLLESADVAPTATADQRVALDQFLSGSTRPTKTIQTACLEICESKFDRLLFSVVDTPGLDFAQGRELKLERQMNGIVRYLDAQYADTMNEESKVVRKSKEDQHIHICIYVIDPSSIVTPSERHAMSSLPTKSHSRISLTRCKSATETTESEDETDDSDEELTMSPAEIRVIRRLSARCNVLPVIGRADSLTDEKLKAVKRAIRTSLAESRLDFGILDPTRGTPQPTPTSKTRFAAPNGHSQPNDAGHNAEENERNEDAPEERRTREVVKLRTARHRSRSRTRRDLSFIAAEEDHRPISPDLADPDSLANVRFSARELAGVELGDLLPFALIAPDVTRSRRPTSTNRQESDEAGPPLPVGSQHDDGSPVIPVSPLSTHSNKPVHRHGPPEDLKGVFTRKFRWGVVDVLNSNHCDFAALRTVVLSTHLKLLKAHTKEVLYEKYRTEKLLARRATHNISEEDRQRLLEEMGL